MTTLPKFLADRVNVTLQTNVVADEMVVLRGDIEIDRLGDLGAMRW